MTSLGGMGTQVAKLGQATQLLMSPTRSPEDRIAGATVELGMGFLESPPYKEDSAPHLARLRGLFDGRGTWLEQAERLSLEARQSPRRLRNRRRVLAPCVTIPAALRSTEWAAPFGGSSAPAQPS